MIVSVHQPQYIPWLGYFHKIANSDIFVYLDNVQYKKREFQNRNKIRTKDGFQWLTVPVLTKGKFSQKIKDVEIDNTVDWEREHLKAIKINYSKAEYFDKYENFFTDVYSQKWTKLIDLNVKIIDFLLHEFQIKTKIVYESELNIPLGKTDRIIGICKKSDANTYFSGQGAREYLDEEKFTKEGIRVIWQEFQHPQYRQIYGNFEPYMSTIDLLFNEGPKSREILLGVMK